ncbi:hypothetical protein [Vallitalea guaymasensis]|uniref:Lipoprotein n=1 Tax=Vallitalea guaymasensis TaxID=1185412 RepID=A0A8J8SDB3_9FIRM|nr:hypothetical protein [Vallitalea guaymasensis]QUH30698.1 hypothetical protein HYG85_17955 [Vallitalea guaymasensis]
MKRISAMIVCVLSVMLIFVGCDYNENKLYNAFKKSLEVTSSESDTDISITLETEGFSEEEQFSIAAVKMLLQDTNINIHTKLQQNKQKTSRKMYVDTQFVFGGIGMGVEYWGDYNMLQKNSKSLNVIKLPSIMMFSEEFAGKEYLVINQENNEDITYDSKLVLELQEKLNKFLKDYALQYNPNLKLVKNKGRKTIDGKTAYVYELSLDNESLSKLINYTANNLLDNKEALEFFSEYMDIISKMVNKSEEEVKKSKEEIDTILENLDESKPALKNMIDIFTDKLCKCNLLGEKGIVIEYALNKEGYIINESGLIDLNIDIAKIEEVMAIQNRLTDEEYDEDILDEDVSGVIKLGFKFNKKIYNINEKVEIDMPKLTKENSVDLNELMKARSESFSQMYPKDI